MDYGSALVKLDHYSIYFKLSNVKQNSLVQLLEKLTTPVHVETNHLWTQILLVQCTTQKT